MLFVHENGQIRLLSADLDQEYSKLDAFAHSLQKEPSRGIEIVCAYGITPETAHETSLLGRQDVGARFQHGSETTVSRLLMVLSKAPQESRKECETGDSVLTFRLFNVVYDFSHARDGPLRHSSLSCEELLSSTLPARENAVRAGGQFAFDERKGTLYHHDSTSFTSFKLDGNNVCIHEHVDLDVPTDSCLLLGLKTIATSSNSTVSVVNTIHKSLLSRQAFHFQSSKQNRRQSEEGEPAINLCSYFSTLQIMVAICGRALVTIPVGGSQLGESAGKKRRRNETLIDSAGRGWALQISAAAQPPKKGTLPPSLGALVCTDAFSEDWEKSIPDLQRLAEARDAKKFDNIIFDKFQLKNQHSAGEWAEIKRANSQKIRWILGKIFLIESQSDQLSAGNGTRPPALKIGFLPPTTFKWLIRCNAMCSQEVELALKAHNRMAVSSNLSHDALISAFSSLANASTYLNRLVASKCPLNSNEVSQALRYALNRVESFTAEDRQRVQPSRGHLSETLAVEFAEYSSSLKDRANGTDRKVIHSLIQKCLQRLHPLDPRIIQNSFKSSLSSSHLITLIDCLRLELACGGWLSQYPTEDTPLTPPPEEHVERLISTTNPNESIGIIVKLLNCTLNALGTTAWITAPSTTEANGCDRGNTLTYMKAEVSAALEGIEEAAYLEGLLAQILLYSHRAESTMQGDASFQTKLDRNGKVRRDDWKKGGFDGTMEKIFERKGGAIITQDDGTMKESSLPLDLQLAGEKEVSGTKVGNGGVMEKRSVREKEYLRRKQVGEYQFERIII